MITEKLNLISITKVRVMVLGHFCHLVWINYCRKRILNRSFPLSNQGEKSIIVHIIPFSQIISSATKKALEKTYGFPSMVEVDRAIVFGSFKPAATALSNHFWNCKLINTLTLLIELQPTNYITITVENSNKEYVQCSWQQPVIFKLLT